MRFLFAIFVVFLFWSRADAATVTVSNAQIQTFTALHDEDPNISPTSTFLGTSITAYGIEQGTNPFGVPYAYDEVGLFGKRDLSAYDTFAAGLGVNGFGSGDRPTYLGLIVRDASGKSASVEWTGSHAVHYLSLASLDRSNITFIGYYLLGYLEGMASSNFNTIFAFEATGADAAPAEIEIAQTPLPAGIWLFGSVLLGAGLIKKRRKLALKS